MGDIVLAHHIPYAAQTCISYPEDVYAKVLKAKSIKGPKYIEILAPCPPGWRFSMDSTVEMGRMAVDSGAWALWEYENGVMTFNGKSKLLLEGKVPRKPVEEWIKHQGRFGHLFKPTRDAEKLAIIEKHVDEEWERYRSCYLKK
jgi:pyruvate ferredoxin oxidoreductase beta subunit